MRRLGRSLFFGLSDGRVESLTAAPVAAGPGRTENERREWARGRRWRCRHRRGSSCSTAHKPERSAEEAKGKGGKGGGAGAASHTPFSPRLTQNQQPGRRAAPEPGARPPAPARDDNGQGQEVAGGGGVLGRGVRKGYETQMQRSFLFSSQQSPPSAHPMYACSRRTDPRAYARPPTAASIAVSTRRCRKRGGGGGNVGGEIVRPPLKTLFACESLPPLF